MASPGPRVPDDPSRRLGVARAAALEAGRLLVGFFRRPIQSEYKRGDSMVSEADRAAERLLRARIAAAFPLDAVLGEEEGLSEGGSGWCWTLDPLDGTQNFLAGVPLFAVGIAILSRGAPVAGIVHDPIRGEMYEAMRGGGARCDGVPIRVRDAPLGRSSLIAVRHRFLRNEAARLYDLFPTRKFRSFGSMCLDLAYAAAGHVDLVIADRPHLWDIAPGAILVEEAGGIMRGFDGGSVFPLAGDPAGSADRRFRIAAGGAAAVEEALAHLDTLAG